MSTHFSMGAINKLTNAYEYPKIANKKHKYECPSCKKCVIFRNGKIRQPHFAHTKSKTPCSYYENPNESQIHKDAKLLLKTLLDNKTKIVFYRECLHFMFEQTMCDCNNCTQCTEISSFKHKISKEDYISHNMTVVLEHRFIHNNQVRIADVALLENGNIKYIFEICHTNKTKEENRPEPWFEINAEQLINTANLDTSTNTLNELQIECMRSYTCNWCIKKRNHKITYANELVREKIELMDMSKEDERTIHLKQMKEHEIQMAKIHRQEELQQIKRDKIRDEKMRQIAELKLQHKQAQQLMEQNHICGSCHINYCKCNNPGVITNVYNTKVKCSSCLKYKCKCTKITNFFKK